MASIEQKQQQIAIADRLQLMLLEYFEKKLNDDTLTDTGAATLARLLSANGWSIDPNTLPQGVRDKLTSTVDPNDFDDDDLDAIVGGIAQTA